jgi:hypothetical protein
VVEKGTFTGTFSILLTGVFKQWLLLRVNPTDYWDDPKVVIHGYQWFGNHTWFAGTSYI